MNTVWQDIRYSFRSLLKSPIFAIVALLSLGLGIGANTAIFSLLDQALLRSLPVQHPEQLVLFSANGPRRGNIDTSYDDTVTFSYPMYCDFRDGNQVFSGVIARFPISFSASWQGHNELISGDLVTGNYFDVLGAHAIVGRTLTQQDDLKPGAHPVVVLSHDFWTRRFGADPGVLNQTVLLNGHSMTIVGIAQPGFRGVGITEAPDVFVPMMMRVEMSPGRNDLANRRAMWLNVFARLKPGVSRQQAEAAMNTFWKPLLEQEVKDIPKASQAVRDRFVKRHLSLLEGTKGISAAPAAFGNALYVLMGMVGLLLLIACANVANLLIARATARQKEISIRLALGAGRWRIARQLLIESLLLAIGGGIVGLALASWTGDLLLGFLPEDPSARGISGHLDPRVLMFALGLSVVTGILFGLIPALQSTRTAIVSTLKDQASNVMGGVGSVRFRKTLVVAQVTLSLVLLIGAGLFARSLLNVQNINPGFATDHLISFTVAPALNGYDRARSLSLYERLQTQLASLPGVRGVSASQITVLAGDNEESSMQVIGYHAREDEDMTIWKNFVGPGYFATMGIPLLTGRDFTKQDGFSAPKVAVINETMAKYFFGNENPIGRRIKHREKDPEVEIVGVVRDSKSVNLRDKPQRFAYFPYAQYGANRLAFYVRTSQDPASAMPMLRHEVQNLDPNLPVFNVKTVERQIDENIFQDRLVAALSTVFGGLATILAAVGLYGVMAYTVVRRTREIGIRMALGADRAKVLAMVMREVAMMAALGIAIALPASLGLGVMIRSQLFGVSGRDPLVMTGATLVLALSALLAGYLPAARAARVDPIVALRWE